MVEGIKLLKGRTVESVNRWKSWTVKNLNGETVEGVKPDDWWNS